MTPELFQRISEAVPGVMYLMTADFSRYIYMNPPVERMLGYPAEVFLREGPKFMMSLAHPGDLARVTKTHNERLEQLNREGAASQDRYTHIDEYRIRHRDGAWRWIRSSAIVFERSPSGEILTVLGVAQDMTEQKEMEQRMRISDRMATVGRLAAGMAHEINNPLAHLIGSIELTAERLGKVSVSEVREALEEMHESANRIARLVRDLRVFSRSDDDEKLAPASLERAIESSVPLVMNEIRHRARLVRDYADVPMVLANESRLSQVFLNLLTNAAQAIPDGNSEENEIRLSTRVAPGGQIVAEVRDTGQGISEEIIQQIFDPFFTTKPMGKGTGLGLAICHHIVQSFGGKLETESVPGTGSVFRVILPQAPVEAMAQWASEQNRHAQDTSRSAFQGSEIRGRILVADDDPTVAEILQAALSPHHDVTVLTHVSDCLKLLEAHPAGYFDLIFSDLIMPQMNGIDFYEAVKKMHPGLESRFIFMTGGAFTARTEQFLQEVPNQVLHKPFRIQAVRDLAQKFIESQRASLERS